MGHANEGGTATDTDPNDDPVVEPQVTLPFDIENEKLSGDVKEDMSEFPFEFQKFLSKHVRLLEQRSKTT